MKNRLLPFLLAVLMALLCACTPAADPTDPLTNPPADTPTDPPTDPPADPPTDPPTTPPTVEPVQDPLRQDGQRLTAKELEQFNRTFVVTGDSFARHPENYYNVALCFTFENPREIPFYRLFSTGFGSTWTDPLDEAEWTFVEDNIGPRNMIGEIDRLPQDRVDVVLDYYFGFTSEDLGDDALLGLHYFDETDAYYFDPAGVDLYGIVEFTDGYYREDSNTVSLYYIHRNEKRQYVVTIQSKWKDLHQYGYYILSNLPAEK